VAVAEPAVPTRRHGSRSRGVLSGIALVVVGAFLVVALVRNWSAVREDLGRLTVIDWTMSVWWGAVALVGAWGVTAVVLTGMDGHLGGHDSRAMHFTSQLGKYVPGSVWPAVIQSHLGARHGIRRRTLVAAYAYALLTSVCAGGLVGLIGLIGLVGESSSSALWAIVCIAVLSALLLAALMHPRGVLRVVNAFAAHTGRDIAVAHPSTSHKWAAVGLCFAMWTAFGLHAWSIARPLGASPSDVTVVTGGFALAYVAGLVAVPLPGGAGVREAMLVITIGTAIGDQGALTVALVSRFELLLLDVVLALAAGAVPVLRSVRRWRQEGPLQPNVEPVETQRIGGAGG
jgi:hypothetical protein